MTEIILWLIAIYLTAGFVFALAFIIKGVEVVDEGAHGTGIGFRIIILPGTIVFWPWLAKKWMGASGGISGREAATNFLPLRRRHVRIWTALLVLLPLGIILSWLVIPDQPPVKAPGSAKPAPLPFALRTVDRPGYRAIVRSDDQSVLWQVQWENKNVLTVPSVLLYRMKDTNAITESGEFLGKIESKGTYIFPLKQDLMNFSPFRIVIYDLTHHQKLDSLDL